MPKRFGKFNPLANAGKAAVGDVEVSLPEPEPEPEPGEQSEFKPITINSAEASRYKSGLLQTRKIDAAKIAAGSKGARAAKTLDVRKQKKEYYFVYEKRHLDWWKSEKECRKKKNKGRKGRISVPDIVGVWLDEGKKNNRFQIKIKGDDDESEGTYQFYAPTKEDQEEWVFFIKEAFDAYQAEATQKRGRAELKQIFESESIGVVKRDFQGLVKSFDACMKKLNQVGCFGTQLRGASIFMHIHLSRRQNRTCVLALLGGLGLDGLSAGCALFADLCNETQRQRGVC